MASHSYAQVAESRLLALERDQASGAVDTYDAADDIGDPSDDSDVPQSGRGSQVAY
ncbi:hypothetical protein Pmar_PMAR002639 [Perkinsus marinus ATCC 50983]|uniref:Uncharacterized protein n=1 Tax=Perkinsus marinus (strain ATCC 50983 / TXsc) TaxID=423536 RepID=C5L9S9_PERM5|nr:hypothetical protein Pmar_PMAR002639 [Perkinsus marinus ATCC 50983]EER06514.1 hypothetical protein Pmar_PMAR002639 [Perkinsus marinus ATCC 50983]|eukprot:XP_002774698.1 hypothetical protein Pmar_PMAR002639 [Perkinsus marinus ATCC 50983]